MKTAEARTTGPQVIDDEPHERIYDRVAGIDVGKREATICTRLPHPARPGTRQATVWTVTAAMPSVRALAVQLAELGIQKITLESTSDYWRIFMYVLSAAGLDVQLVSATHVRQLRGRPKTDLLTELPTGSFEECARRPGRLARFAARDQRRRSTAGLARAGGAAGRVA